MALYSPCIVVDRATGLFYNITLVNGVFFLILSDSAHSNPDPVILDLNSGQYWQVYIQNQNVLWYQVNSSGSGDTVYCYDSFTAQTYLFQLFNGVQQFNLPSTPSTQVMPTVRIYVSGNKEKVYYMGTGIKFTAIVSPDVPDSVLISIKDPGGTPIINQVPMIQENSYVYSYVFQTTEYGVYGKYTGVVTATIGSNSAMEVSEISIMEQPGLWM